MDHLMIKVIVIIFLFCATLLAGLLPYKIGHGRHGGTRQTILSYCNCFAGGVFLSTSFLDLLPMIRVKFQAVFHESKSTSVFPVAEFTTCLGFFLVLIIEQIVHTCHNSSLFHGHGHGHNETGVKAPLLDASTRSDHQHFGTSSTATESDSFATNSAGISPGVNTRQTREQTEGSLRTYILVLALAMHSIFEGLALGLIVDLDRLAQIAAAVLVHKSIIAFSLGVSMVQHRMTLGTVLKAALIFSIMGPIGISIGIGVLDSSSQFSSNLASGILQGIANGTFLFVTFFEILQSELSRQAGDRLLKVLFMIIGFSLVTGLLYYANILESKSHSVHGPHSPTTAYNLQQAF